MQTENLLIVADKSIINLARSPDPDEREMRQAPSGNLCRCTGHAKMVRTVQRAAKEMVHG